MPDAVSPLVSGTGHWYADAAPWLKPIQRIPRTVPMAPAMASTAGAKTSVSGGGQRRPTCQRKPPDSAGYIPRRAITGKEAGVADAKTHMAFLSPPYPPSSTMAGPSAGSGTRLKPKTRPAWKASSFWAGSSWKDFIPNGCVGRSIQAPKGLRRSGEPGRGRLPGTPPPAPLRPGHRRHRSGSRLRRRAAPARPGESAPACFERTHADRGVRGGSRSIIRGGHGEASPPSADPPADAEPTLQLGN